PMSDRDLVHLVCALRVTFPQVGIVLSTREPAALRDLLIKIGITMMSAGSHTEPGGYTGQGKEKVHRTVRGRIMPPDVSPREPEFATSQFEIGDPRSRIDWWQTPARAAKDRKSTRLNSSHVE